VENSKQLIERGGKKKGEISPNLPRSRRGGSTQFLNVSEGRRGGGNLIFGLANRGRKRGINLAPRHRGDFFFKKERTKAAVLRIRGKEKGKGEGKVSCTKKK